MMMTTYPHRRTFSRATIVSFCLGGVALALAILLLVQNNQLTTLQKKDKELNAVVAPYYDADVFKTPSTLIKSALTPNTSPIKIPIIMYHYVEYVKDDNDLIRKKLDINPALFEQHLQALKKAEYETYFVKDIPDILNGTIHYSTHSAVLTFDDGYEDFYTDVFPLLKKYHMRATAFIIYNYIGRKGFMTEQQIRELLDSDLVEIGGHTFDHLYLKSIPKHIADRQIIDSKQQFEKRFGFVMKSFAYPYGAFNQDNIDAVKKAGYVAAVSVIPGVMQSPTNLFYLSRIRPGIFTPSTMISVIEKYSK